VSVVIATYGRPSALHRALASLERQSQPAHEVVVVAWEHDRDTVASLSGRTFIRLILVPQNTVSAKENAGIAAATGEIVAFMDDDAAARSDWLERMRAHYDDRSVVGVGGRDLVTRNGTVDNRETRAVGRLSWFGRLTGSHHLRSTGTRDVQFLKGCNMSYLRSVIAPVDGRLKGAVPFAFEIDMGLTAIRSGRLLYDPELVVDHFASSDMSAHQSSLALVLNHNVTYVILKHLGWPRRICFLAYTFLIGDRDTIGLLRVPMLAGRPNWTFRVILAHFRGKLSGVVSFLEVPRS
jgi:GT2 family glycosyltransferase